MPRVCGHGRSRRDRRLQRSPEVPQSRTLIGFPLGVYGRRPALKPEVLRGVDPGGRGQEFWVVGLASPICVLLVPARDHF